MNLDRRTFMAAGTAALLLPKMARAQEAHEKALHESAKQEGELTWYSAHYTSEASEKIGRAFTEAFPGVKVNVVRTTAQVAYQRLTQDLQANTPNCDIFASTDIGHFISLKERKLFLPYKPENAAKIDSRFRNLDPDGAYHATSVTPVAILYNTNKVKPEQAPKSWTDLLDPKWRSQVSVGHPGFSGFVGTWVVQMRKLYGWDYFEKLAKNKPQIGRSIIDTVTTVASGERMVAAGPAALAMYQASRGNPIGVSYPSEGSVLMVSPSAIMANTRRPNASKLFIEFLYGPQVAQIGVEEFGTPLRTDVTPRPGVVPLSELKVIRPTAQELVEGIPAVTEQWRDTFGI